MLLKSKLLISLRRNQRGSPRSGKNLYHSKKNKILAIPLKTVYQIIREMNKQHVTTMISYSQLVMSLFAAAAADDDCK